VLLNIPETHLLQALACRRKAQRNFTWSSICRSSYGIGIILGDISLASMLTPCTIAAIAITFPRN
jgi:hypothetical protein